MIKSYCKINLSLNITKKLKYGLHDIQTNNFLLNIYDEIRIKKKKYKDHIKFVGKFSKYIKKSDNTVLKTIKFLRIKKIIDKKEFYEIIIKKNIPVFSGLGGGTSNAFHVAKYFLKNKLNKNFINLLEKKIGSDFKLFLFKQSFQKSLKKILKYKRFFKFYIILIFPNINCSTKLIYSKVKKFNNPVKTNCSNISSKKEIIEILKKEKNDLQNIVLSKYAIIKKVIYYMSSQKGCKISRMTGSGSVIFGIYMSEKLAKLGLNNIQKIFPNYWCVITKTI